MYIFLKLLWYLNIIHISRKSANVQRKGADYNLGNNTINSYVYIGGLPPWYTSKLKNLALPSVVFEPRLRGENLKIGKMAKSPSHNIIKSSNI